MRVYLLKSLLIVAFLASSSSYAREYFVVTSSRMKKLSVGEIKAIYLKKISYADDVKVIPVNLDVRDNIRKSFETKVLKMSLPRLKSYWTQQHYLGHRPPVSMRSQESIKIFLKKVPGSIGYISIEKLDESLQILYRWEE